MLFPFFSLSVTQVVSGWFYGSNNSHTYEKDIAGEKLLAGLHFG